MLTSFIGSFKCKYSDGILSLPEPFHWEGVTLSYHCSRIGDTIRMRFHQLMQYVDGTTEIPEQAVTIAGGKVTIPVCDHGLFENDEVLEATGYGQGIDIRRPKKGFSRWRTVPEGYITLAGIGQEACRIVSRTSHANTPIDSSSVEMIHRPHLLHRLLIGFDGMEEIVHGVDVHRIPLGADNKGLDSNPFISLERTKPLKKYIEAALRHTGFLILVSCVGDGSIAQILPYIQKLAASKGITVVTIAIMPTDGDYHTALNAGMALRELGRPDDANAIITIPTQAILDQSLMMPKPYDSFERDCFESNLTYALVAAVEYAVSAVILPLCHAERICQSGGDLRKTLFQNRLMDFSLRVFRGKGRFSECGRELERLANEFPCCHVAAFGSMPLGAEEKDSLTKYVGPHEHVSFHYGEWSAVGNSLLVIALNEVNRDALYDVRTVNRWAMSYWQKAKQIL